MEDFYDFGLGRSGVRLPSGLELKEIKQMLLTRDRVKILQSVDRLKLFLNSEKSLSEVLKSDICEFLCDAVLPLDSAIVSALYNCIEEMSSHVEFYSNDHSSFAVESLIRTLNFVLKDSGSLSSLNQCLNLLNVILIGYTAHNVIPEKKTIENLVHLLSGLQKNLSPTVNNKYQTGNLILRLIELGMLSWSRESCDVILSSLSSWFTLMQEITESEHSLREKLILLWSSLCHAALRFLLSNNSVEKVDETLKNEIINSACEFYVTVGAPYFDKASYNSIENEASHLEDFYQAILFFYNDQNTLEKHRLIHGLSEQSFLQFTTRIISLADFSHGQKLRRLCVLALFLTVLHLSEDVFLFPEVWPTGQDDFRTKVQRGISQLPLNATQWLDVLVNPHAGFSSKLALLLYLYFYSMTAKSQDMLQAIYPAVVAFIRSSSGIESSVLLLKIVWFVFVMCQLSISESSILESEVEITNEMVSLLEAHEDLSLVYTHHPALLYWAFSSKVTSFIQTQTVHLWLKNKTSDCKELDELMRNSSDARFAILDILQNGWGKELDAAFSSLKTLLLNSNDGDLPSSIWFLLPRILAKFTADSTSVTNVDYVIELCSLKAPESLDSTRIIRIASLLPEVFLRSDLISIVPSLSLILRLAEMGQRLEDHRVLGVFLRHDGFILKIIEGLNAHVADVSVLSIKIMNLLWKECKEISLKNRRKIILKKKTILKMLEADCDQVLSEGLDFLEEILLSNFHSPVFEIKDVSWGFVEILFLEIQNICVKAAPNTLKRCWSILTVFLSVNPIGGEATRWELVSNPFLHEIILFALPSLKTSHEMKNFLIVWLNSFTAKLNDPCLGRRIYGGFFLETVQRIGRALVDDFRPEDQDLLNKVIRSGFDADADRPQASRRSPLLLTDRHHRDHDGKRERCIFGCKRTSPDLFWKYNRDFARRLFQTPGMPFPEN